MMLYPPVADLVDKIGSRYQLVNLVARRARTISAQADPAGEEGCLYRHRRGLFRQAEH